MKDKDLRAYTTILINSVDYCNHWLTPKKGVHKFRFFLPTMRTPNSIVVCSCMYASLWKWDPMLTPSHLGVESKR